MATPEVIKMYENYATCNYLAIVFAFLALFLTTIASSLQSWQKAKTSGTDSNYYLNIGLWQWSALAKNNNENNVCGDINKDTMFSSSPGNYLDICRYVSCIACGLLAISLLTPLSNNKAGIIAAIIFTVFGIIVNSASIILYYTNVYKNADVSVFDEVPIPENQDWTYGSSLWFNLSGLFFAILAIIMFGISLKKYPQFGSKDIVNQIQNDIIERDAELAKSAAQKIEENRKSKLSRDLLASNSNA